MVARTPEWDGPGPGAVAYPVRHMRLVVRTQPASSHCDALLSRLLDTIDAASSGLGEAQAQRVRMLAGSLRLVAGREAGGWGTTDEVVRPCVRRDHRAHRACSRCRRPAPSRPVLAPEVAALVLVQLAVNAERHDAAESVRVEVDKTTFRVVWRRAGDLRRGHHRATPRRSRALGPRIRPDRRRRHRRNRLPAARDRRRRCRGHARARRPPSGAAGRGDSRRAGVPGNAILGRGDFAGAGERRAGRVSARFAVRRGGAGPRRAS